MKNPYTRFIGIANPDELQINKIKKGSKTFWPFRQMDPENHQGAPHSECALMVKVKPFSVKVNTIDAKA